VTVIAREAHEGVPAGFVEVAQAVYRDDPRWIPEDPEDVRSAFSRANPWFDGRGALALCIPGKARAAVFHDPAMILDGGPAAFFGYWESTGDASAEDRLMTAIRAFARERGARRVYGPIQFSTAHTYRLRLTVEPDGAPFLGEPYNAPSYPDALQALGFRVRERYVTQLIDSGHAPVVERKRGRFLERVLRDGYRIEPLDRTLWRARLPEMYAMVEASFREGFAYAPMTFAQFAAAAGEGIAKKLSPDVSMIAYAPTGEPVGFCLVYPQYAPLISQSAPDRVSPRDLDWDVHMPLLRASGPVDLVLKTICVVPSHQRLGVGPALAVAVTSRAAPLCRTLFGALIREDNPSRRLTVGCVSERTYALYASDVS
jgi:ribosomal protein S18 acetylase RimI-like enzyme